MASIKESYENLLKLNIYIIHIVIFSDLKFKN